MSVADRTPPSNLLAEQQLLGGLMLPGCDPAAAAEVWSFLEPGDFYRADHERVAEVVRRLFDAGVPTDTVNVHDEMARVGLGAKLDYADPIGGDRCLGLISELVGGVPHAAMVVYHARIVLEHARRRRLLEAADRMTAAVYAQGTADEALAEAESILQAAAGRGATPVVTLAESLRDAMANIAARDGGEVPGVPTGLADLDRILGGGLGKGWLAVIGARPGHGKSCLAMHCAEAAARLNQAALVFSLEMGDEELAERMLSAESGVFGHKLKAGGLTAMDLAALGNAYERLVGLPVRIDDTASRNVQQVAAIARREKARGDLGIVVVDYLQLVDGTGEPSRGVPMHEVMAKVSRRLKVLARELEVPVVALSQLNRECESRPDKRPMLADLRSTGAIEQDADVVMLLFRPEAYDPGDQPGVAECIVAKNRHGRIGTIRLGFNGALSKFSDYAEPAPPPAGETGEPF